MPQYLFIRIDDCPGKACEFEFDSTWTKRLSANYCKHHQSLKDSGLSDDEVYQEISKNAGARERARQAAKLSLGLDKEHPGVPFKIEDDGTFTLGIDQKGNRMPEWDWGKVAIDLVELDKNVRLSDG